MLICLIDPSNISSSQQEADENCMSLSRGQSIQIEGENTKITDKKGP